MTPDAFLQKCPTLWHVAPPGAWDRIRVDGFLTAEQLIRRADLEPDARAVLLAFPRGAEQALAVDGHEVVLRDQEPLVKRDLEPYLDDGVTVEEWIGLLNRRVFLFKDKRAMETLRDKYVARAGAQDLITISPWRLLQTAAPRIELTALSTSALARKAGAQKGRSTFVPLRRFNGPRIAEVTVVDGLDDLSVVVQAERWYADGRREPLPTL